MDLGTVPQWIIGIGTLIAFGWAVFLYRRSVQDHTKERPRRVYVLPITDPRNLTAGDEADRAYGFRFSAPDAVETFRDAYGSDSFRAVQSGALHFLVVKNDSDEVITQVRISMRNAVRQVYKSPNPDWLYIEPGGERRLTVFLSKGDGRPWNYASARPEVRFVDAGGKSWLHGLGVPLTALGSRPRIFRRAFRRISLHRSTSARG